MYFDGKSRDRDQEATSLLSAIETRESIDVCRSIPAARNRISKMNFIWPGTNTENSFLFFLFFSRENRENATTRFLNKRITSFENNGNGATRVERKRSSKFEFRFAKKFQQVFSRHYYIIIHQRDKNSIPRFTE